MPRLSNNSVSVRGGRQAISAIRSTTKPRRLAVECECASGPAVRNTRLDAWLRSLRWPDALAGAEGREFQYSSPLGFLSPAQQGQLSFFHGTHRSPRNLPKPRVDMDPRPAL